MPKVTNISYSDGNEEMSANKPAKKPASRGAVFMAVFLILAFIMGTLGGFGGLLFLSSNQNLKERLGLKDININTNKTEKLVLEESSAVIDASKKVSPAVVSILSKKDIEDFFGRVYQQESGGTGFIITNDGLILTNKHVVSDANAEYTVFTADGKNYQGKVLAQDPYNDLAVIKIDATGLPVVELGDSDNLEVGQWVMAIGNALGEFQNSVTLGVVSAKDRKITTSGIGSSEQLFDLIQTDAAINSGNSGGPLVNLKGQVVGINTAVASNAESIGFAIPINSAKKAIESVKKTGKITRPMIGVRYVNITKELAKANGLSVDHGALVYKGKNQNEPAVVAGGPADKAGVKEEDIILSVNNEEINENNPLNKILLDFNPGDEIELNIQRGEDQKKIKLTLGEMN